jgi:exosome complex component RRP45
MLKSEVLGADDVIVYRPALCALIPLALHHAPYCITFTFYRAPPDLSPSKISGAAAGARGVTVTEGEGEEMAPRVLLDPAGLEHRLAQELLHLALTPKRELAVLHKAGGLLLAFGMLMGVVQVAVICAKARDLVGCVRPRRLGAVKDRSGVNECAAEVIVLVSLSTCD